MRKIRRNEIDKTCRAFAEMFEDYPLYFALFGKDEKTFERNFYLFKTEVLLAKNYTYANDDFTVICSVKRPSDKEGDMRRIFANPFFAIPFFKAVGKKQAKIALEYAKTADEVAKRHYDPSTDCYIKNVGVAKSRRGQGLLRKTIDELCKDMPICLETHDEGNVAIYEKLGFKVLETVDFHGAKHYFMKRERDL